MLITKQCFHYQWGGSDEASRYILWARLTEFYEHP